MSLERHQVHSLSSISDDTCSSLLIATDPMEDTVTSCVATSAIETFRFVVMLVTFIGLPLDNLIFLYAFSEDAFFVSR